MLRVARRHKATGLGYLQRRLGCEPVALSLPTYPVPKPRLGDYLICDK